LSLSSQHHVLTEPPSNRLAALYSDFRILKTTNVDGYNANIEAWRQGLATAARAGATPSRDLISIDINEEFVRVLETKWGRPLSLGTVVKEAIAKKEMLLLRDFVDARDSIYKRNWQVPLPGVGDVLGWGLKALGILGEGQDRILVGRVVIIENLETAGKEVARRGEGLKGRVERIFSKTAFQESFGDVLGTTSTLSEIDVDLLLKFLVRDKGIIAYDGQTIKMKAPNERSPGTITTEDTTIASLKSLINDLEIQTRVLTKKVDELSIAAKDAVARKNRVSALAALKSKKLAEATLTKRHATLAQLEEVFSSIEQAADQVELVQVMEASSRVLSGLNKEVGGVERVDDIVDELREQMSQVDEVGNIIAEVGQGSAVDEGEVDDELEAMEREEREKREAAEKAIREEKEKREAAETKRRLDSLEEAERQAKEKAAKNHAEADAEMDLEGELKRLSLEPDEETQITVA
jgi:charged multivesicular body protein 7